MMSRQKKQRLLTFLLRQKSKFILFICKEPAATGSLYLSVHNILLKGFNMTDNYEKFKKDIFALTKIDLNAYKERQMKRRIDTLITKHGFNTYDSFVASIKANKDLFEEFVNYLTINVSEFYRNPDQWKYLEEKMIPDLINKFGHGIKIWSAACSTGDEPYSLVMLLSKFLPLSQIKIFATDIDEQVIAKAKTGLYRPASLTGLPEEFKKKYFTKITDQTYQISDEIKKCVEFKKHNLLKDPYPTNYHMIVCRNVLIYFTEEAKQEIYRKFNESLVREGVLFVGSTEQVTNYRELNYESPKSFFYSKK